MANERLSIPVHQLAFLQAYLYEVFSTEKRCEENFKHTEWYLNENYSEKDAEQIIKFFNEEGLNCDCDLLKKLDLQKLYGESLNFHK